VFTLQAQSTKSFDWVLQSNVIGLSVDPFSICIHIPSFASEYFSEMRCNILETSRGSRLKA
jgi:hypothetical protein